MIARRAPRLGLVALTFAAHAACSAPSIGGAGEAGRIGRTPTSAELAEAHRRLAELRAELGERTEEIRVSLEAPLLPGEIRARGAIAVAPGRAARMILVGPGGSTAVDLWMDRGGHRIAMPARDEVRRGRRGEPASGMPLELLRGWFLEPFEGELLHAEVDPDLMRLLLRTDDAWVRLEIRKDGPLLLERTPRTVPGQPVSTDRETIRARSGIACGEVLYDRARTGVRASIVCERRRPDAAARALLDPDAAPGGDE